MARSSKPKLLAERGHRLPLELETRLAAHCDRWGEPSADVVADAVELLLDGFVDGVSEDAAGQKPDRPARVLASADTSHQNPAIAAQAELMLARSRR